MAALHSPSSPQAPHHTFLDKKPPMLPRQSTSDVLSFTHIIANRLLPGQNVWDFFSPASSSPSLFAESPDTDSKSPTTSGAHLTPPISPSFGQFPNSRRSSLAADAILYGQPESTASSGARSIPSSSTNALPPTPPLASSLPTAWSVPIGAPATPTPKLQKRRSFAQSLRNSMLSLTQLLSPNSSRLSSPASTTTGPPHYNILVLGSDSAPLASTLYKLSSLLPCSSKIRHYQEISGFFVAYFRSNGSLISSSPKMLEDSEASVIQQRDGVNEVKSRRGSIQDDDDDCLTLGRSSEETLLHLEISSTQTSVNDKGSSRNTDNSTASSVLDMEREEIIMSDDENDGIYDESIQKNEPQRSQQQLPSSGSTDSSAPSAEEQPPTVDPNSRANASLSVHAFSLDTTWPVPRILAQTFWFPFAHGIIYIVDATRKNDPRGVDHLVNARQFLASLIADPHFKRKDIPVVVFANKAGLDPETCYRVDEIAEILGCEDWDIGGGGEGGSGVNGGLVEQDASGAFKTRPWCVKSTRSDGDGDGLREAAEWLKSRCGEVWRS
ncbi:hypothetical protein BGZ51_000789 [Haplosporangium sp. Z 767]|nr:hypothetical protein BGZ50_003990 [Haplosporangium sp. Z 11]KAF9194208.1 hypothetical protein BGZ51_000789 [Haplosporangium sp. Z 767]